MTYIVIYDVYSLCFDWDQNHKAVFDRQHRNAKLGSSFGVNPDASTLDIFKAKRYFTSRSC